MTDRDPKAADPKNTHETPAPERRVVIRACQVCEWEAEQVESGDEVNPDCPWCHGPTTVRTVTEVPEQPLGKNVHAAALGRLGGVKGGHARAAVLSPKERQIIARNAARARWGKTPRKKPKSDS